MKYKLKQLFMAVLCVAVVFTAMPVMPVYAAEAALPTITAYDSYTYPGREFYYSVYGNNFSDIYGLDFTVYYDADVMSVTDSTYAGGMLYDAVNFIDTDTPGAVHVTSVSKNPISTSGELLGIRFKIHEDAAPGEYPVVITAGGIYNSQYQNVAAEKVSGSIVIQEKQVTLQNMQFYRSCDKTSDLRQGDTFTYRLSTGDPYNLAGGSLLFTYDAEILELNSAELGNGLADSEAITSINTDIPGEVKIMFAGKDPIGSDWWDEYAVLSFTVKANTDGNTCITFEAEELFDVELNPMTASSMNQWVYLTYTEPVIDYPDFLLTSNDDFDEETRTFTVDVSLDEGSNVAAGDFTISYDTDQMVCTALEENSQLSKDGVYLITKEDISNGKVKFSYIKETPYAEKTRLMTLSFRAADGFTGDAVLSSSGLDVVNADFEPITLEYPELTVFVPKMQAKITGTTAYAKTYGDGLFRLDAATTNTDAGAVLTYQSSNEGVAQVNSDGEVYITGAGRAVITVSCQETENYKACSGTVTVTVDQADISTLSLSVADSVVYTGSALKPAVTIPGLVEGRDFTAVYSDNTNVGTAIVTVTGQGNYKGELTGTFEITAAGLGLTADDIQLGEYDQVYDGKVKEPAVTIKGMSQGTDYTVSYTNNINAGEATVTVTGCGNYSGSASKTFPIEKASLSGRVLTLTYDAPYIYDNTAKKPTASISGLTMNTDFTVSYTNNKNAGEATVTATGKGNYTGTTAATFIIERALIPEEHISVSGSGEYEYTGNAFTPRVAVGNLKQGTDYKVTYQHNTDAGIAKIFIEGIGNYKDTFERTFTIHPTSITAYEWDAVLSQESYTYDGQAKTPEVTIADGALAYGTDFEVTYLTNVDAGQAAAQVTGKGNYKDSFLLFFGINPAQITKEMVQLGAYEKVYDGNAKEPEAIVGGGKLTEGTDYEVSYSNNTNAGDKATVTVTGKDNNYTGEVTIYFEITAASLNDDMFTLANVPVTYNGSQHTPAVIAAEGLEYGRDYTVTYGENTAAGEDAGTVTITGRGNYEGTVKKDFAINPAVLTEADASLAYTQTGYNGSAQTPGVTVSKFGNELKEGTEFEVVSYADNTNVGTATVTIQGKGNFTGTIQKKFEILQHGLTAQDIELEDYEAIYNGQPHTPKVTIDGHVEGADFEVSYDKNTNAGTADVIVKGITNHSGEVTLHFTIKPADLSGMKAELRDFDPVYDGTAKEPSVTVEGLKDSDYNVTYSDNTNVGEATVTIEGKENYTGVIELKFSITAKSLESGMFSLSGGPFVYNGKQHTPVVNAAEGLESGTDYTVSYENKTDAGTATVTITGCGNYTGTVTKEFTIEKAAIDEDAISLAYPSVTYNGQAKEPAVNITGLTKGTDFEVEYLNNEDAGTAKVIITGVGNYSGTFEKTFTINPAPLDGFQVTFGSYDSVYDGQTKTPPVSIGDLMEGTDYIVSYGENVNAGEAAGTVTITGQGNYTGTVTAHFNIDPAKLNAANVKLGEYEQIYDGTAKEPQVIINGLEAGADYTVAYADNVNAGKEAKVTITGKDNYSGEVTICFEITAASLNDDMFALEEGPFVYNGSKHTPAVNAAEGLEAERDYTVTYGENVNAGKGTVTITGKGNYAGTVTKEFAIARADFSKDDITLSDTEIEYTGNPQGPNVMVEGLIKDQDYTVEYHNNEDTGQATVTVMGIGNYTGQYELTFTIKPAVLTEADASLAYTQTGYNGTEQTPAVTVIKFGETLEQGTHYDVTYSDNKNAGEATVTIEGKGNYTGSVALKFTITEQGLAADDVHLKYLETFYDGTEKKPEVEIKGLTEGDDFSVEYADNINVGTAKVTVIGKGNHSGEVKLTFTIKPADLSDLTAVLGEYHPAYDGSAKMPDVTIEGLTEGTDYTVNYENNVNAGTEASVVITGKGNYTGTLTKYFTIEPLKLADWADALTLEYLQAKYDGTAKTPAVTIEGLEEGTDYTVSYSNNVEAGKAFVTVTGMGNYGGQLTAEFEIIDFDVLLGDVNLDRRVSAADLTMLARHVSGIRPVTDIRSLANADVDRGGDVGSEDLTKLARYVAKIITAL